MDGVPRNNRFSVSHTRASLRGKIDPSAVRLIAKRGGKSSFDTVKERATDFVAPSAKGRRKYLEFKLVGTRTWYTGWAEKGRKRCTEIVESINFTDFIKEKIVIYWDLCIYICDFTVCFHGFHFSEGRNCEKERADYVKLNVLPILTFLFHIHSS